MMNTEKYITHKSRQKSLIKLMVFGDIQGTNLVFSANSCSWSVSVLHSSLSRFDTWIWASSSCSNSTRAWAVGKRINAGLLAKTTFQTHSIVDHVMQSNISAVLAYTADSTSVISAYLTARHIVKNSRLFLGIAFGSPRSIVQSSAVCSHKETKKDRLF